MNEDQSNTIAMNSETVNAITLDRLLGIKKELERYIEEYPDVIFLSVPLYRKLAKYFSAYMKDMRFMGIPLFLYYDKEHRCALLSLFQQRDQRVMEIVE